MEALDFAGKSRLDEFQTSKIADREVDPVHGGVIVPISMCCPHEDTNSILLSILFFTLD